MRSDALEELRDRSIPTRVYVPFGGDWFRYWMRRLAESRGAQLALDFAESVVVAVCADVRGSVTSLQYVGGVSVELESVMFESPDPQRDASFWGSVLGRPLHGDEENLLLPGNGRQVGIRFAPGPGHGEGKNRLHLHLTETDRGQGDTIATCLGLGGRLLGSGHVPANGYAVMADVVGDEFCVIEDGNSYLAGCGPLGEVTCEGTRVVGVFWSQALGWPLVWDEDGETAIQSPAGGTKIAWSGDPATSRGEDRQSFVLTVAADELQDEIDRLMTLGASDPIDSPTGTTTLRDPDGVEFALRSY